MRLEEARKEAIRLCHYGDVEAVATIDTLLRALDVLVVMNAEFELDDEKCDRDTMNKCRVITLAEIERRLAAQEGGAK